MRKTNIWLVLFLLSAVCIFFKPVVLAAEGKGKVAVLPFEVNSLEPLDYLKVGFQKMLSMGMEKRGFKVINPGIVNKHPGSSSHSFEIRELIEIGEDLGSNWIIA